VERLTDLAQSERRARLGLIGVLFALAVIAWAVTDARMEGMDAGPGTDPGRLGFFVGVWVVMMAAMMFPSVSPTVLVHARLQRRRRELGRGRAGLTACFVAGYLLAWTAAGLVAYGLFELGQQVLAHQLAWDRAGRWVAGGVLLASAAWQLTPYKDACLTRCRSPLGLLLGGWRDGRGGALRMGASAGAWCVGCCWGLMASLFALGVMSLGWMAFVAALIALEKTLPWRNATRYGVAVLLTALGLAVLASPSDVPGLRVPGSAEATDAMDSTSPMPMPMQP
jgi:predicted metal-binding membrane protein